jgi:hypothetical protein
MYIFLYSRNLNRFHITKEGNGFFVSRLLAYLTNQRQTELVKYVN